MKKAFPIIYRTVTVLCAAAGIWLTLFSMSDGFMGSGMGLNYYTTQSNIWAMLVSALFIVLSIMSIKKENAVKRWHVVLKFVVTVAITVTLLVFWAMLAPMMGPEFLATPLNLLVHTITPLLMVFDLLIFDRKLALKKSDLLFAIIPQIYYLCFALLRAEFSAMPFAGGSRYPYWFMDIDSFGWFGNENGIGVFWWVMLVVVLVTLLGLGFMAIRKGLTKRAAEK